MRNSIAFAGLCAGLLAGAPTVAAPKGHGVRRVQLISMVGAAPTDEIFPVPGHPGVVEAITNGGARLPVVPPPDVFRVHDLSRRYVQFRMQQEMAAAAGPSDDAVMSGASPVVVAAFSSIAVPGWLRGEIAPIQAVSFKPGCAPMAYRPSGFLARSAESRRAAYYGMMSAVACEHGIPTGLFDAMIIRESGYNPVATSTANAYGLVQLMPRTAVGLGVNRYDPLQNMRGGARYLRQQLDRFGQVHLALAAYNAGPGRIHNGLVPRITETQAYVSNIIANWSRLTAAPRAPSTFSTLPRGYTQVTAMTSF